MGKELVMNYDETIEKLVTVMCEEMVVFFVASGISVPEPTKAPSGMKLRNDIVEAFRSAISMPDLPDLGETMDRCVNRILGEARDAPPLGFEEVCQVVSHATQDYEGFVHCLDTLLNGSAEAPREPNLIHYFLARCLKLGHLVVTPNYDSMIEEAWSRQFGSGEDLEIYYDENGFRQFMENLKRGRGHPGLLKVHGTFHAYKFPRGCAEPERAQKYESVITTLERVGKGLPQVLTSILRELIRKHSTVFMGYSANDIDIMYPIFAKAVAEEASEKLIFWLQWDPENPCQVLGKQELAEIRAQQQNLPALSRNWGIFNVATLLDNRNQQGVEERAWRIDADSVPFVQALGSKLGYYSDEQIIKSSQHHNSREVLDKWVRGKEVYQQLLALAGLAGRVDLLEEQHRLCDLVLQTQNVPERVQLMTHKMAAWATRTRNREESLCHSTTALELVGKVKWPEDVFKSIEISHLHSLRALSFRMTSDMVRARDEIYRALGERPCYEAVAGWALGHTEPMMPWETAVVRAARKHLVEDPRDEVAEILNRVANVLYTSVRDPSAESTPLGALTVAEEARLKLAIEFAKRALHITDETGNVRCRAQVLNILGPALAKLGTTESVHEAKDLYEKSQRIAGQLGWTRESAQHPRQMGIVYEAVAEVQRESGKRMEWFQKAIEVHEEAIRNWKTYGDPKAKVVADSIRTAKWHLGRILIKKEQYKRASTYFRAVISSGGAWQVQANARAFLLVALIRGKTEAAATEIEALNRECEVICSEICSIYEEQLKNPECFKAMPYACSNALANLYTVQHAAAMIGFSLDSRKVSTLRSCVCQLCQEDPWLADLGALVREDQ